MFFTWPNVPQTAMTPERYEQVERIAHALPRCDIVAVDRKVITLKLPDSDETVTGDITQSGFTVYFGGFDWVTYPTPAQLLQRFPEFLPLPQQVFADGEEPLDL